MSSAGHLCQGAMHICVSSKARSFMPLEELLVCRMAVLLFATTLAQGALDGMESAEGDRGRRDSVLASPKQASKYPMSCRPSSAV